MSKPLLIILLTTAAILVGQGLKLRRTRYGMPLVVGGVALLVLTVVLRLLLGD